MAQERYRIISKLDSGGMAEVWKGKATSLRGFEKLVAIKRVLAELAKKDAFISMFLDEARLSLHLNHANVVQTFDVGSSDNAYFIVMEWVDGINLKGVLESLKLSGERLPVEQALFIAMEVCKGLYHAHRRSTPDGEPLNIVHRDVSPPNVLISREGEVKLVDFGLAKAATQAFSTDQGMIKGKFSYLSPEAAWGQELDERADIFAVGAILWEMLAGRKLFEGKSNKETVLMVRQAEVPSLEPYNPYVDARLMAIIRKSLTRDPTERYRTAKQLSIDLSRYLFDQKMMVTSYNIAELIERTMVERKIDQTINPSMMDDIGQLEEQLVQFTSLDDLQRMQFRAVTEHDAQARHPALPNAEDPRAWAAELGVEEEFALPPIQSGARPTALRLQAVHTEPQISTSVSAEYATPQLGHAHTPPPMMTEAHEQAGVSEEGEPQTEGASRTWLTYALLALALIGLGALAGQLLKPKEPATQPTQNTLTPSVEAPTAPQDDELIFDEPLNALPVGGDAQDDRQEEAQ